MTNTLYVGPVLGHRLDGRPIYGVSGGAEGDGTTGDAPVVGAGTDVGGGTATPPVVPWTPPASQADLDKIVADRLARQKAQFGDYETFKAAATELQAIKDGQKSELQKAQDLVAARDTELTTLRTTVKTSAVAAAAATAAAKVGSVLPGDQLLKLVSADAYTVGDDLTVTGLDEAFTAYLTANPALALPAGTTPPVQPGLGLPTVNPPGAKSAGHITRAAAEAMSQEEYDTNYKAIRESSKLW